MLIVQFSIYFYQKIKQIIILIKLLLKIQQSKTNFEYKKNIYIMIFLNKINEIFFFSKETLKKKN